MIRAGSIVSLRAKNVKVPAKLNLRARMYLSLAQTSAQITVFFTLWPSYNYNHMMGADYIH